MTGVLRHHSRPAAVGHINQLPLVPITSDADTAPFVICLVKRSIAVVEGSGSK